MSSGTVTVPLWPGTDGDATHRPKSHVYTEIDPPTLYLQKVGAQWLESRGEKLAGVTYSLERLPAGYALYQRPRPSDPKIMDKWLYGHPSHKVFDSPNRFFPHFKYLMDNDGSNMGCPCTVCNARGGVIQPIGASASTSKLSGPSTQKGPRAPHGRPTKLTPGLDTSRVDEEGTPDVYRNLIDKLKKQGTIDEEIVEPMSMDWRCEQEILPKTLKKLHEDPKWSPRAGELVIFVKKLDPDVEISCDASGMFKLYDLVEHVWLGDPSWEAGVVGQPPAEATDIEDLVHEMEKKLNLSYSGLRVEPLPDPNSTDKSLSKQYKYIPLHQARPFVFWKEILGGIKEECWHATILHAMKVMSSFSLVGKHRFRGTWPNAQIYCHGIYLGSELLCVGDTVRLLPRSEFDDCTDILVIKSVRLKLSNLDLASENDYDGGRPYNSSVCIVGKGHTLDQSRSNKQWLPMDYEPLPHVAMGYPTFYPLHPSEKDMQVPLSRILGRLFEAEATSLWFPPPPLSPAESLPPPSISAGQLGIHDAREYARRNDGRIHSELGSSLFWGDSRAEALDLQTVNGLEVWKHDTDRDPKKWRSLIKNMELAQSEQARLDTKPGFSSGIRSLRNFMA
ncbi:hypothetical protein P154DRAFT_403012, partial [Amniculicola lignicola CBS 123094]